MLLDYLLPILQDSIITDKVTAVNHYVGKFQSKGNRQSEKPWPGEAHECHAAIGQMGTLI